MQLSLGLNKSNDLVVIDGDWVRIKQGKTPAVYCTEIFKPKDVDDVEVAVSCSWLDAGQSFTATLSILGGYHETLIGKIAEEHGSMLFDGLNKWLEEKFNEIKASQDKIKNIRDGKQVCLRGHGMNWTWYMEGVLCVDETFVVTRYYRVHNDNNDHPETNGTLGQTQESEGRVLEQVSLFLDEWREPVKKVNKTQVSKPYMECKVQNPGYIFGYGRTE